MSAMNTTPTAVKSVDELIASCEGIIVKLARKYYRPQDSWITLEELKHEATVATWKAAQRWRELENKNASFSTYAWNWIRHDLYLYVCQNTGTIYVPRQGNLERRKKMVVHTVSLDAPRTSWGETWHEFVAPEQGESLYSEEEVDQLHNALRLLNERDRWIITQRFFHERTLENVAKEMMVTREAVRQLQVKAMKKLKLRLGELNRSKPITHASAS